jgi:hypothetical protein
MDNLDQIGRSLMDNWGEIRQLITDFVAIDDPLSLIRDPWQMHAETYTRLGTVPQRVITRRQECATGYRVQI